MDAERAHTEKLGYRLRIVFAWRIGFPNPASAFVPVIGATMWT
jgi:hypothetical protein